MMSKRTGFQFRQPRAKMPKLNITITSSQSAPVARPSTSRSNQIVMAPPPEEIPQTMDMWGDEDDEFIMLASQVAEKVEANAQQVLSQAMSIHDISYGRFTREVHASTQMKKPFERDAIIKEFMDLNEDEDIFSKLPDFDQPSVNPNPVVEESDMFAEPLNCEEIRTTNKENTKRAADTVFNEPFNDIQKKAEKAKAEAQSTFLANKLREKKKEIENLKESLAKINDKCQTKEGEASTLRYELELNKQQYDKLRKEKLAEIQNLEKDYLEKVANLEKTIKVQKSEIDFKNMEILNKRSRRSINETIPSQSVSFQEGNFGEQNVNEKEFYFLFKLHSVGLSSEPDTIPSKLDLTNMHYSEINQPLNNKDANLLKQLQFFQMTLHQLNHLKQCQSNDTLVKQIFNYAIELIVQLKSYSESLELQNCSEFNPALERKILSEKAMSKANSFEQWSSAQEAPIVVGERLIFERRILSVIAVLCYYCKNITSLLLDTPLPLETIAGDVGEDVSMANETFTSVLISVLMTIGFSKNDDMHCGFINAAANYLCAIIENYTPSEEKNTVILNLFKAIVFCQPGIQTLRKLSDFLEIASKQASNSFVNILCHNRSDNIITYHMHSIRRYSPDTCPLQVYAGLLQAAFPQYEKLSNDEQSIVKLTILMEITIKLMIFLRNCFKRPVPWLFRRIENGSDNGKICHCYCYVVSCIIVLLHLSFRHWIDNLQHFGVKNIKIMLEMATIFLNDNFNQHCESKVLQLGDMFIKNRLQVIYDWIMYYQQLFKLGDSHQKAIKSVNLRRIILMNEPQRISTQLQQQGSQPQDGGLDEILNESFETFC